MAKRTRLASSHGSTRPVKKPRCSLTTELAKELCSPRGASDAVGTTIEISAPLVTTKEVSSNVAVSTTTNHRVASDVVVQEEVIPKSISETVPTTSEADVVIVTSLDSGTIPSLPVMMPKMATAPHNSTTALVSSCEFLPPLLYSLPSSAFHLHAMDGVLGVGSPRPRSASDQSLSSKCVDYLGTGSDDGMMVAMMVVMHLIWMPMNRITSLLPLTRV